jgi:hypothetical protein
MKKRTLSLVAASALALGGVAGGVAVAASGASAADTGSSASTMPTPPGDRADRLKQALSGLVSDGTLTQGQADKVASTLAAQAPGPGRGGHDGMHGLDTAAGVLGISAEDLRKQLEGGKSLADVAAEKKVDKQRLIDELVKAAQTELDEQVRQGRLPQAQADERKADLSNRITSLVERKGLPTRGDRRPSPGSKAPDND